MRPGFILRRLGLAGLFYLAGCTAKDEMGRAEKNLNTVTQTIESFRPLTKIEVRNYVRDAQNRFQKDIAKVKKLRIKLQPNAKRYLEINFFTDEKSRESPLIAQFILFDAVTKNILQEENIRLE